MLVLCSLLCKLLLQLVNRALWNTLVFVFSFFLRIDLVAFLSLLLLLHHDTLNEVFIGALDVDEKTCKLASILIDDVLEGCFGSVGGVRRRA